MRSIIRSVLYQRLTVIQSIEDGGGGLELHNWYSHFKTAKASSWEDALIQNQ